MNKLINTYTTNNQNREITLEEFRNKRGKKITSEENHINVKLKHLISFLFYSPI